MNGTIVRRVGRLEQKQAPEVRRRYVFWDRHRGEPKPVAEPGEVLTIYSWMGDDDEESAERGERASKQGRG